MQHIDNFIIIEANDINPYLSQPLWYDTAVRGDAVIEFFRSGLLVTVITDDTKYELYFKEERDAIDWHRNLMDTVISQGVD